MKIRGGQSIDVYRHTKDRFGDKVSETFVGTLDNCVLQWASSASVGLRFHPSNDFEESFRLSAVIFCPRKAPFKLEPRDRFKLNGKTYQVAGERAWDQDHPATGFNYGYYMSQVELVT